MFTPEPQTIPKHAAATLRDDWASVAGPARSTIHVQFKGDITGDPSVWMQHLKQKIDAATGASWALDPMGAQPAPGHIAPVADAAGAWDGGLLVAAADPAMTARLAKLLNNLCVAGAAGSRRVGVRVRHDYEGAAISRRPGNVTGGRR